MSTHFRVISSDEYNKALDVIAKQRELFVNAVRQFEKDLTYLRGTLASIWAGYDKDYSQRRSLEFTLRHIDEFSLRHIDDMHSMLNDFETILKRHDTKESENGGKVLYNENEMCQGI